MGRIVREDGVAFGVQLPVQAQSSLFAAPWERTAGVDELVAVAQVAERSGFGYVAVCDHVAIPKDRADAMRTTWWDCTATLSFLAARTDRVRLVSHVYVLGYRHPLAVAKQWMTLDALSGGRAVLGVGAGHVEDEFDALGVDFGARGRLLDEAIDAVRAAFTGEFSSHEGKRWSWSEMGQRPRPVRGTIPIWVGGSSRPAIRRAALRGDGWLPQGPPEGGMVTAIDLINRLRHEAGLGDDPFTIGGLSGPLYVGDPTWDVGRAVTGSAERLAAFVRGLADLGVDQIQVAFPSRDIDELCDQLRAFGTDVIPLMRG